MDNSILASDKEARAILESLHRAERSMIIWAIRIFGLILDLYTTFSNRNIRVDEMMIAAALQPENPIEAGNFANDVWPPCVWLSSLSR